MFYYILLIVYITYQSKRDVQYTCNEYNLSLFKFNVHLLLKVRIFWRVLVKCHRHQGQYKKLVTNLSSSLQNWKKLYLSYFVALWSVKWRNLNIFFGKQQYVCKLNIIFFNIKQNFKCNWINVTRIDFLFQRSWKIFIDQIIMYYRLISEIYKWGSLMICDGIWF